MKRSAVLIFLISSFVVSAQSYQPFITPGKQFTVYWDEDGPGYFASRHYWFDGDTIVNSKFYHKLWYDDVANPFDNRTTIALIREDTVAQQVYRLLYTPDSLISATEQLLYDFALQPGDSLLVLDMYYQWHWKTITYQDSLTLLNGKKIRRWHTNTPDYFGNSVLFSEAIPFGQVQPDVIWGVAGQLNCAFTQNAVKVFGDTWCDNKYIDIAESSYSILKIYPNPASSIVVLNSPVSGEFELIDVLGNLVLQSTISGEDQKTVSVANLPAGLYVWVFKTEKGVEKGKLMIQR